MQRTCIRQGMTTLSAASGPERATTSGLFAISAVRLQEEVVHESEVRSPGTDPRLALDHVGPRGESRSPLWGVGSPNSRAVRDLRTEVGKV